MSHRDIRGLFSRSSTIEAQHTAVRECLLTAIARWRSGEARELPDPRAMQAAHSDDGRSAVSFLGVPEYFAQLEKTVILESADLSSPLCMGHMTGAVPHFGGLLGELVATLNQNLVKSEASPALTHLESETLATLHHLVYGCSEEYYRRHYHDQDSSLGLVTSGGSLSNLTAFWIARNLCFGATDDFPGIEITGMARALERYGYQSAVVVGSKLMHYSIEKAVSLLGLGAENVLTLPVDSSNRLDVSALKDCISDCAARKARIIALVGVAGTTDCGSIDPLEKIGEIAGAHNIFFHVDAAWGGPLLFSERCRPRLAGIEKADSVVLDGHKQMYLPVGVSAVLFRDPKSARVIEKQSRYMLQEGSGDLGRRSLEGSRSGASLYLHAGLQLIGAEGYAFLMEANLENARNMADLIAARPEFELLVAPETNILLFRGLPARLRHPRGQRFSVEANAAINIFNEQLQKRQSEAGRTFVSRTTIEVPACAPGVPMVALRAVISHPLLEESHMRIVLDDLVSIMAELESQQQDRTGPSIEIFAEGARSAAAEVLQSDGGYSGNGGV
jgi:putative pyridoxal-dependent aspartate 1-decarboxylase